MLVSLDDAKKIVADCKLVATKKSNGYSGSLANIEKYRGNHGYGYTITTGKTKSYYIYDKNVISKSVYDGEYTVMDAVITSRTIKTVAYNPLRSLHSEMIWIKPTWQLDLDTITGKTVFKRTDDYKPITLAGRILTICWYGEITNTELRSKIRRKMHAMLKNNKAQLVESGDLNDVRNNVSIV